jgi:anthranilate synthase component 2
VVRLAASLRRAARAGRPVDSGISLQVVRELGPDFPLFGVCMGHQCIGEAFGGALRAAQPRLPGRGGVLCSRVSFGRRRCTRC